MTSHCTGIDNASNLDRNMFSIARLTVPAQTQPVCYIIFTLDFFDANRNHRSPMPLRNAYLLGFYCAYWESTLLKTYIY
uniref:Uncharacterized protein n=1 Tax=Magallana gigas TaxID=29159 RepID=K1PFN8_MAGGI